MANETQILGWAVADLLHDSTFHHSSIPSPEYPTIPFTGRAGRGAEGVIMQNKPNFRMAQLRLTAGQEEDYVKRYELCVCENKANLAGRACSVPVRASVETQHFASPRTGPRAKQSQFPPALANAGWFRPERQPHGPNGCGRNPAAIPEASVGRASPLACLADSRSSELSWENAQPGWRARTETPNAILRVWEGLPSAEYRTWGPEPTLGLLCGPNPAPNGGCTRGAVCD